jgi:predicted DNA-binding protein
MTEEKMKSLLIRFPEERYYQLKEIVVHLRTDMTTLINELVEGKIQEVMKNRK